MNKFSHSNVKLEPDTDQSILPEGGTFLVEKEAALLSVDVEEDESTLVDLTKTIMTMMTAINLNTSTVCKHLSTLEGRVNHPSKKQCIEELVECDTNSSSEGEISDSEKLVAQHNGDGSSGNTPSSNTSVSEDKLMNNIAQEFDTESSSCPCVSQKLAEIVNKHLSSKLEESKFKGKLEKYNHHENCDKLVVPKVNPEIWTKLTILCGMQT